MQYDDALKNRLKRVEGQIRGILSMMEQEKDCREIVTQLTAVRTAVDRALGIVVGTNLAECVREELQQGGDASGVIQEAIDMLVKSR
ncbi:metal-sensitive transcriptional regulator [Paenibacillus sediminis]|uniref:DNA-binding FrmR family transcriptional regulator n=1 Tax=Paenibacillus sediminis TaxID=664909 RepID=A0ABS4H019_9BACL|nr:metal-sensitive transcriptional regulator [Paenibacillus sediminis]MBP1935869.1 DNA-binding FrmR family transcriptional regulator [Paenibacillus sediminis]